jgi:hypothetical protein
MSCNFLQGENIMTVNKMYVRVGGWFEILQKHQWILIGYFVTLFGCSRKVLRYYIKLTIVVPEKCWDITLKLL